MTELLSDAELDRGLKMAEAATPGPWEKITSQRIDGPDYAEVICPGQVECMAYCYGGSSTIEGDNLDADLEFIAFARDALPRALAELRVLRGQVEELRQTREREWAVCWIATDGSPVTDIGASPGDVRELARQQEGYAVAVRRFVGPWEPVTGGDDDA